MAKNKKIQCHFISNTHWDREWRFSAQRTRYMLVYLLDMLLDIFEKEPNFKSFHMDSQTLPIQDYLEARPDKEELIKKYVKEEKLFIGPWFCLPDEFCIGGESIIRNLLLGHKMGKKYGKVSKTGYSPFSWGQISQMPQIYKGFGIDMIAFYRGINSKVAPNSEFFWQGPDGSKIVGSRLAARPRYNSWYILQRPVFYNLKNENERALSWKDGNGPFKFIDMEHHELDYQFTHQKYAYHKEHIPERAEQSIKEQDGQWSTEHRFWSLGHDSSCPDIREVDMIRDSNKALGNKADVFHSSFEAFQKGILDNQNPKWPVLKDEMRHPFTVGSSSTLYGWVISARTYIKQDNFKTEKYLINYAEPLAVFAGLMGAPFPSDLLTIAYNWLLQNHGHDCIGCCSRDVVHDDMIFRSRQSREISGCIMERALMDITGSIKLKGFKKDEMALVVYNPTPFKRSEVIDAAIEIPLEWECDSIEILDDKNKKVESQQKDIVTPNFHITQNPNDCANTYPSSRYYVSINFNDVPGMGYSTFKVRPVNNPKLANPETMLSGPQTMENEFLKVTINSNGTLYIYDKKAEKIYNNMGYFQDESEIGNPWEHVTVPNGTRYTTLNENARITLIRDGALEAAFRVEIDWALPECRSEDEKTRSNHLVPYKITNTVTLRKAQKWVEVLTELNNNAEDHYLQVSFPSNIVTKKINVQGQFDVVERNIQKPDYSQFEEAPQVEEPMNSFVDVSDGQAGLALLNDGLKAYQAFNDPENTISLTLLRSYPLRICVTDKGMSDYSKIDKGSQCPGPQAFKYAVMPHEGDWEKADVWAASEQFTIPFKAIQLGVTDKGTESMTKSFLEVTPENLHVSAVKQSEDGKGWVVRLFNPFNKTVQGKIRLNGGGPVASEVQSPVERVQNEFVLSSNIKKKWKRVQQVNLEELPEKDLKIDAQGWVGFSITKKKILTLEFLS